MNLPKNTMQYKIPIQKINNVSILLCAFIISVSCILSRITDFTWLPTMAIMSTLLMIDMLFFSYLKTKNILSIRSIFLFLSFLFHMGYTWIFLFNSNFSFAGLDFTRMFSAGTVYEAYVFSLLSIIGVYLGIQLGDCRSRIRIRPKHTRHLGGLVKHKILSLSWKEKSYLNLGIVILLLSLPLRLYIDLSRISIGASQGYLQALNFNINGYLALLADFSIIGIVLIIIYYRNQTYKALLVLLISISYYLMSTISGSRGGAIVNIIVLLFTFNLIVHRFRKGAILSILAGSLLISLYVTNIGLTRVDNSPEIIGGTEISSRFLQEFGGTQLTVILVQERAQKNLITGYGTGYLSSLASILPNIGGYVDEFLEANNFVLRLNYPAIGGSYIGELYYNFRILGILAAVIVGFFINKFEALVFRSSKSQQYALFAFLVLILRQLLWWIRDTSEVFPRYIMIGYVIFFILIFILKKFGYIRLFENASKEKTL
jgi:hypothetical protein